MTEERRVARNAGMVGAATMLSRVLGLVREQVMAGWFGAGFATDAFNVAFRIPNLLRDLFAEGAMSSAFVPTFTETLEKRGREEAWALGRQLLMTLLAVLLVVCVVGYVAAPWLVAAFAPGFEKIPGKLDLTLLLTRVMLPFLPAVALAAACMGMLNALGQFGIPALAPALLNVGMIVFGLGLIPVCTAFGAPPILAMAIGVVVGGLLQFVVQLPPLARLGFRWRWERPGRHPGVNRVAGLMLPATIGLAATQLNLFVSTLLASTLQQGSVSWLWYAFRVMQLPIGVFGVALATVSLPALARAAVAGDRAAMTTTVSATVRLVFVLTLPSAVWLAVMAEPIVALLYEHGHFHAIDTTRTAGALLMYCIGLPMFAAVGVLTRAFYALGDTRTPVRASFIAVAINLALNLLLIGPLGHLGLALATSCTSIVNFTQLAWALRGRLGSIDGRRLASTFVRMAVAGGLGAGACLAGLWWSQGAWHRGPVAEGVTVLLAFAVGASLTYAGMAMLRVEERTTLVDLARGLLRRVTGGRGASGPPEAGG